MKPNNQQKGKCNQNDRHRYADHTMFAIAGITLLVLISAGMINAACAMDGSDVRSPDAQIAVVHLNSTVWGDPFALNISDRVHEEYGCEKSIIDAHDDIDLIQDFSRMHEQRDVLPDEYLWMHDIAESSGIGYGSGMPREAYQQMHEGSGDYGGVEHDGNWSGRAEELSTIDAGDEPVKDVPASASAYTPTATEEFSGEVVQLTGAQTADIVWNKDNFGGFCYDMYSSVGTETLTIAAGALIGPNVDRTIETGDLTYTTAPFWQEYELHRNLGLTVERNRYTSESGYWTEFWMGERYVAINGKPNRLAKLLVEFNSTDTKTLTTGEEWDLGGGFSLTANQVDLKGNKVWFTLEKNGHELDSEVIGSGDPDLQDRVYTHTEDVAGEPDIPIFSCYVSQVFRGTESNLVQVKYAFLIDNVIHQINSGAYYDNMRVTSATSTQIALKNWKSLYLSQSPSTCQIMGNLFFKTRSNTGAIEFYPYLIRNEPPILPGGFASSGCGWHSWNLSENCTIGWDQVDLGGTKVLIVLCKDGVVVDERIMTEEWRAPVNSDCRYSYAKNGIEIVNATLKMVFRGCNANMIELGEVYQYSEVDGGILINNESHLLPTAPEPSGTSWNLSDGYAFTVPDVGLQGNKVRLQLSKDGVVVKEKILSEDYANTFIYTSGIGGVSCVVDRVFHGCEANAVKLADVDQYSEVSGTALIVDGSHFCKLGDPEGMAWELSDGYVLTMKDLNYCIGRWYHVDDKVWLELSKDGVVLEEDILESGGLFEYRNGLESFDCVVEVVFHGHIANVVKLTNINQYSSTGTQLIDTESKTYATADPTEAALAMAWELCEGYSLAPMDIDCNADKVWLSLFKDGVVVKDAIVDTDDNGWFTYYNSVGALIFRAYVDTIYCGTDSNSIQLKHVSQYSEIDGRVLIMFEDSDKKTLSAPTSIPKTLTVDDNGGADYTHIQAAIDVSDPGDTIMVHNGTYHENVRVNKQLTLIGIDMPVVDGGWNDSTIEVTASYCIIDGFQIVHSSHYGYYAGIRVLSYGNIIKNNSIHDNNVGIFLNGADSSTLTNNTVSDNSYGIRLYYSSGSTLRDNEMSDNTHNLDVSAWSLGDYTHDIDTSNTVNGKHVYYYCNIHSQTICNLDTSHLTVACSSDVTITDNNISGGDGIYLAYTNDSTVSANTINSNGLHGTHLKGSHRNEFTGNSISYNAAGVYMDQSSNNEFIDNTILSNRGNGISLSYSQSNEFTNNMISNNDDSGIYLSYSQSNILLDNKFYSNLYGIRLYDSQSNTIKHNSILGSYYGIYLYGLSSNNRLYHNNLLYNTYTNAYDCGSNHWYDGITGNYWDDYIGVDADDNGIGDVPYNISSGSNQDPYPLMKPSDWEMPDPKTIYVDDDFADDPANHKWNTINEGLDDTFYNDTIVVHNGTYTECVQISMPVRLVGIGMPVVNHSTIQVSADGCTLDGFRLISGGIGVYSDGNAISNNTMSGYCSISLSSSSNNTLRNNDMAAFEVDGGLLSDYIHDIDTSNTVDGKPVYYLVNAKSHVVDSISNAGYVAAINSSDITIRDLTLRNSSRGILFYHTNDSIIENVDIHDCGSGIVLSDSYGTYIANNTVNSITDASSGNRYGIMLGNSHDNHVMGNSINLTGGFAVFLDSSGGNTLESNSVNSDYLGILAMGYSRGDYNNSIDTSNTLNEKPIHYYYDLHGVTIQGLDTAHLTVACSDNVTIRNNNIRAGDLMFLPFLNDSTITGNTVQDSCLGIYLYTLSSNNTLYHNNFIDNAGGNAYDGGIYNQWDSGSAGNYWSDYVGNDTDGDGIGDDPYYIQGYAGSVDSYPLMHSWNTTSRRGDLNSDNQITSADAAIALQLVASGGWDANADVSGDHRVTSLDALMILQAAAGTIEL